MSGVTFGMKLKDMKAGFFDRAAVLNATDKATARVLSKFGAYVRRTAQLSIRSRKGASAPGTPPRGHVGLLRRFILFAFDQSVRSVVIGPALLNGKRYKDTGPALELGGVYPRRGRNGMYPAKYPARPFMKPAFDKELPKLPAMWANTLKR